MTKPPQGPLLVRKEVLERLRISKGTLHNRIRANEFPKGEPVGGKTLKWSSAAVDAYIASFFVTPVRKERVE